MTCAGCVANVESSLKQQVGVKSVIVSLEPGQAVITYDPSQVRTAQLVEIINNLGYKASL
jgi:copper chaperone